MEKILIDDGWYFVKQVGSHKYFKHPSKNVKFLFRFILETSIKEQLIQYLNRQDLNSPATERSLIYMKLTYPLTLFFVVQWLFKFEFEFRYFVN